MQEKLIELFGNIEDVKSNKPYWKNEFKPTSNQIRESLKIDWSDFIYDVYIGLTFQEYLAIHLYHSGDKKVFENADRGIMVRLG